MSASSLEQELRDYFQAEVRAAEPPTLWWSGAVYRATEQKRSISWLHLMFRTRLAWALIPLALLLLAGVAYASSSVVRELFTKLAPWVEESGLSQEMNLSQTVDGVTVRVERVYADANAAVVGYTISGPPITSEGIGQRYFSKPGTLTVEGGPTLKASGGMGTVPGSEDVVGNWRPNDRLAVLAMFDTSVIEGSPSELKVTMPIVVYDRVPVPEAGPATARSYSFDFTIKFHPATVVDVDQTVEVAGVAITLDQVRIAPWESRVSFTIGPPYDDPMDRPWPEVTITSPGGQSVEPSTGRGNWQYFYGDFSDRSGEWTAVISRLNLGMENVEYTEVEIDGGGKVMIGKGGQLKTLEGPWVFHFTVP